MHSITKKIIATVTTVTCAVWMMGPGVAQAATVAELQALIESLTEQLAEATVLLTQLQGTTGDTVAIAGCTITSFDKNLKVGSSGDDVKCLQIILNSNADTQVAASGTGSSGKETTYFGPLTKAAVIKFQEKYASDVLTPVGLTSGTGYVGSSTRAKLNTLLTSTSDDTTSDDMTSDGTTDDGTTGSGTVTYENKISFASNNPSAATIAKGAQNVIFAKLNVCAASEANTISKMVFVRSGIAADGDISDVKLYEGVKQLGSTQAVNTSNHKATFSSLNWTIAANSCKVLTVKSSIASGATAGDTPKFKIESASDITSTVALDGVYPIESNGMTIAGIATGWLEVSTTTSPSGSLVAGSTEQAIAIWKLTASSTEGVKLHSIKMTEVGSSVDTDVSNVKLFYGSTQLGSTVASLDNSAATFDLTSNPLEVLAGTSKNLTLYVDLGNSTGIDDRNIRFEVTAKTDITAYGTNSGGEAIAYGNTQATDLWPLQGQQMEIDLGSLTVAQDTAYSPSAQEYARGTTDNNIMAFKFTAGANENIRITYIKLTETVTALGDSDISNVTLYDAETGERLTDTAGNTIPSSSMVSGYVTFGSYTTGLDATGLFDIAKSKTKSVMVKADVSSAASTATSRLGFKISNPTTDVKGDGISSGNDLGTSEINAGSASSIPSTNTNHDIIEKGSLTVSVSPSTPATANYTIGTNDFNFAKFDLISTGEDIKVSQFNVYFATDTDSSATTTAADAADINNIEIWEGEAGTGTLLATDAQISSGYAEFAINLTVTKNTTKTLTIRADVPTGADAGGLQAWIQKPSDLTCEGALSGVTITASAASWSSVKGSQMVKGNPHLTIKAAPTPAIKTFIKNTSQAHMGTFYFTATNTEDLTITRIKIYGMGTTSSSTNAATTTIAHTTNPTKSGEIVRNMVESLKLYDGSTLIASKAVMTDGTYYADYADFTGLSYSIPKGTTKVIDLKMDVKDSATTSSNTAVYFYFGIASGTADVAGSGKDSGTALSATTITIDAMGVFSQGMRFGSAGTLTITNDANPPSSAIYTPVDGKVALGKWKFTAADENITLKKVRFDVRNSSTTYGYSESYTSPETSIDDISDPKIELSLNGAATSSVLSISQLDQAVTAKTLSTLELTAAPHASVASGTVVTISSAGAGTTPYIISSVKSNTAQSTTTVIGATAIADTDGYVIDSQTVSTTTNMSTCVATTTVSDSDVNGYLEVVMWGGATSTNVDCSAYTAGTLIQIGNDYAIASTTGPSETATGTLRLLMSASSTVTEGDKTATTSIADNEASANTVAYNDADTGAEIATYLAAITGVTASYSNSLYRVSGDPGYYSVAIYDSSSTVLNVADELKLGLKYGGTESLGKYLGADANFGDFYLYDGDTQVATGRLSAATVGAVIFDIPSGYSVPVGTKYLTVKTDVSAYTALTEGSTVILTIGSTTATDVEYITAEGTAGALAAGSITLDTTISGNEMWLYATKPTLTLNSSSPSGTQTTGSNKEVFRFDVKNAASELSMYINSIRFKIEGTNTSTVWDKTYKLYNYTADSSLSTDIGFGTSYANATATDNSGWVTIHPSSGNEVGTAQTVTYVLTGNTSSINDSTAIENLTISIQADDFYWDDALASNANKKVSGLPLTGNTLSFSQ